MPTPPNLASETGRDAAVLDVGLSTALVREAADDALPERDATGLTGASTPSVFSSLTRYWRTFRERQRRNATVHDLSDRELTDIGLTRGEIDCIARHRAIDALKDSTTFLWIRSGM
jgi:uncharacterized protein YjiS (DUF1127 family)